MSFVYAGDPGRYYPDTGIEANPGDVLDEPPADDGRWFPVAPPATPADTAPKFDTMRDVFKDGGK